MNQPPRSNCMVMAALPSTVRRARSYARWVLDGWQLSAMADTVTLLVSELVTNAVSATGAADESVDESPLIGKVNPIYLCLSAMGETVLIEVWDVSATRPLRRTASDEDEAGRGLLLVQTLSKEWGCEVLETGGKVVWCKCLISETA
jgi:anti-sigma regulatory factor (Ser/Thr protein kinase)